MITLTQAERLVRKIAEVTVQPDSAPQMAKLAQDYADLCRAANRRLEQCAVMIEAGQFLQALQLAETPPTLLDLITVLSFRQATEWRNYCQGHQLPWTEPFYDKYVRLISSTYNKGIPGDHPFYRDYRRAVMNNDDDRAISIVRVISRLNSSDENMKGELKRLEEKLLRGKLENLRQMLAKGDTGAAEAQLAQIETSGLPIPSAHPVWQQAQVARCQQLLRRAEALRQQDAWQDAEVLVEEVHIFATQYKVQLSAADAECWTSLASWTKAQRAAFADDQDFQRAVSALDQEIKIIESKQATKARPSLAEVTSLFNSLAAKESEAERFNRPLDQSLTKRREQSKDWLQHRMKRANRRKLVAVIAVTLVVAGAIGAALFFVWTWWQERDLVRRLGTQQSQRRVFEVKDILNSIPPRWNTNPPNPQVAESIAAAKRFLDHEMALSNTFDTNWNQLTNRNPDLHRKLDGPDLYTVPAQIGALRKQCEEALAKLAPDFQPGSRRALQAWDAEWQGVRIAALSNLLADADSKRRWLDGANGYTNVQEALHSLQTDIAKMEPWMTEPPPLDSKLQAHFLEVSNLIADWKGKCEGWDDARSNLQSAQSLDEYLNRLDKLWRSPFASTAQRDRAAMIGSLKIDYAKFLGGLLLPNAPTEWSCLTNTNPDAWPKTLMPETPTEEDKDVYFKLQRDTNMQNVFSYKLVANPRPNNPCKSHIVYAYHELSPNSVGHKAGMVYDPTDPSNPPDTLRFIPREYDGWDYSEVIKKDRMQESDTFEQLGVGEVIDNKTGKYQKPILQLLDKLNQADTSPVFRAVVTLELLDLAELRPAEWGLDWCPGAAKHLQGLKDRGAMELKSGDWMFPSKTNRFDETLKEFFGDECAVPLEKQARFLQELTHAICVAGFEFAGYVDDQGLFVARQQFSSPAPDYWGWGSHTQSVGLLFRKTSGGVAPVKDADPLPFTPLFVFMGNRTNLLEDAELQTSYTNQVETILPPLFQPQQPRDTNPL